MSEISDDQIAELANAISFPIMRGAEYEAIRQWLSSILAVRHEKTKKECMGICNSIKINEWGTGRSFYLISTIEKRISELKP